MTADEIKAVFAQQLQINAGMQTAIAELREGQALMMQICRERDEQLKEAIEAFERRTDAFEERTESLRAEMAVMRQEIADLRRDFLGFIRSNPMSKPFWRSLQCVSPISCHPSTDRTDRSPRDRENDSD